MGKMEHQRQILAKLFISEREEDVYSDKPMKKMLIGENVCKYFLSGLCPYLELFKNTKSDLGSCKFDVHDAKLREYYLKLFSHEKKRYGFLRVIYLKLKELVREIDRKIIKNKFRADDENKDKKILKK